LGNAQDYISHMMDGTIGRIAQFGPTANAQFAPIANLQVHLSNLAASLNGFLGQLSVDNVQVANIFQGWTGDLQTLQGQSATINNTLSAAASSASYLQGATNGINLQGGTYASGGFTGRGGSTDYAGIVHKGEYVLTKEQVDQSTGKPKASGSSINYNIYGDQHFDSADAVDRWFERLNSMKELGAYGVGI